MPKDDGNITVVKDQPGRPHAGKVFAVVHAHSSDAPHYAAGLCAKLMAEGYTGYLVRTTNDEKSGGQSMARNILNNEQEHLKMAGHWVLRMFSTFTIETISWTESRP